MKILFMGTPAFAIPSLEMLVDMHEVVGVVTQKDKPKGRGKKLLFPPVKEAALARGIEVLQPEKVREPAFIERLKAYHADAFVVVAYGQILPESVLEIPPLGCINVHGSLLPQYRGAAPMQWSVINGEVQTGITTMYMSKGLDTGDMILKRALPIAPEDTFGDVHDKMSVLGAQVLQETLALIACGKAPRTVQEEALSSYAPMITKQTGCIKWQASAQSIVNLIRGLAPLPGAYTYYEGQTLKIWRAQAMPKQEGQCGEVIKADREGILVCAKDSAVLLTGVQALGGKKMDAAAYLRGHAIKNGTILG